MQKVKFKVVSGVFLNVIENKKSFHYSRFVLGKSAVQKLIDIASFLRGNTKKKVISSPKEKISSYKPLFKQSPADFSKAIRDVNKQNIPVPQAQMLFNVDLEQMSSVVKSMGVSESERLTLLSTSTPNEVLAVVHPRVEDTNQFRDFASLNNYLMKKNLAGSLHYSDRFVYDIVGIFRNYILLGKPLKSLSLISSSTTGDIMNAMSDSEIFPPGYQMSSNIKNELKPLWVLSQDPSFQDVKSIEPIVNDIVVTGKKAGDAFILKNGKYFVYELTNVSWPYMLVDKDVCHIRMNDSHDKEYLHTSFLSKYNQIENSENFLKEVPVRLSGRFGFTEILSKPEDVEAVVYAKENPGVSKSVLDMLDKKAMVSGVEHVKQIDDNLCMFAYKPVGKDKQLVVYTYIMSKEDIQLHSDNYVAGMEFSKQLVKALPAKEKK